ncbi:hypothetical protein D3C76_1360480 [compost metagenome]
MGLILEVGGLVHAIEGVGNVRHRTPDGIARALHISGVGLVFGNVLGQDEVVFEAEDHVLERYDFFFGKGVSHDVNPL